MTLLHWEDLSASELNAMKIARFMGRPLRSFRLAIEQIDNEEYFKSVISPGESVIASAQTLVEMFDRKGTGLQLLRLFNGLAANVFVYGFDRTARHGLFLQALTSDAVMGVEAWAPSDSEFTVEEESRHICRQFSGLSFGAADPDKDLVFVEGTQKQAVSLIRIGRKPFFTSIKDRRCHWLLSACRQIADLDIGVPRDTSLLRFFSDLAPLMMFIGSVSGDHCWHNDAPTACFIIDDPLLREQYGFLDYRRLLELMERERFCTSMAFIPWNYRRSDSRVLKLFLAHSNRYSLCVHGCDHTKAEFGARDEALLREKSQTAINRMVEHKRNSGLSFDDVMVFPQGIFSVAAMKALKACNYLAAVNSTSHPIDAEKTLTLADLLQVAVTRFSNFPLFVRRGVEKLPELAFDLFLGKPALIVAHHDFFREGYGALAELVGKVNSLDDRLHWTNLAGVCSRACLKKVAENGDIHLQFFTDRFLFRNDTAVSRNYVLLRRDLPDDRCAAIRVNGRRVNVSQDPEYVKVPLSLDAAQSAEVAVERGQLEPMSMPNGRSPRYRIKVFIRRRLSEFRDNYVDRNRFLSESVSLARRFLNRKRSRFPEPSCKSDAFGRRR